MAKGIQCCTVCGTLEEGHTGPADKYICTSCFPHYGWNGAEWIAANSEREGTRGGWISANEALPPTDAFNWSEEVIVALHDNVTVQLAFYNADGHWYSEGRLSPENIVIVSHWMSLPQHPAPLIDSSAKESTAELPKEEARPKVIGRSTPSSDLAAFLAPPQQTETPK